MLISTDIGERFPETAAHLLAMQRLTTSEQLAEAEQEKALTLPDAMPAIYRGTVRRWCSVRKCVVIEDHYELR